MADTDRVRVVITGNATSLVAAFNSASASTTRFGRTTQQQMLGVQKWFQGFAKAATTVYVLKQALDHILGPIISVGREFDKSLYVMKAAGRLTADQFEEVSAYARQLGQDLTLPGVSAADAALAMSSMTQAGMDLNDTFAAAPGVLALAKVSEMDVGDTALLVARTLKTFNLEGSEATRVADLLTNASLRSTATVQDLAFGMESAGNVFNMANMPVEDMITSLAIMNDKMLTGTRGGTTLKTMLMRLFAPTGKAADLMEEYGIKVFDSNHALLSMGEIIKNTSVQWKNLNQEQQLNIASQVFGVRGIQGFQAILAEGSDTWDKYSESVNGTTTAIDFLNEGRSEFEKSFEQFNNFVDEQRVAVWENGMAPAFTLVLDKMNVFFTAMDNHKETVSRMAKMITEVLVPALGFLAIGAVLNLGKVTVAWAVSGYTALLSMAMQSSRIIGLASLYRVLSRAIIGTTLAGIASWEGFQIAVMMATGLSVGAISLIVGSVAVLTGEIYLLWTYWDTLKEKMGKAGFLLDIVTFLLGTANPIFMVILLSKELGIGWEKLKNAGGKVRDTFWAVKDAVWAMGGKIKDTVSVVWDFAKSFYEGLKSAGESVKNWVTSIPDKIKEGMEAVKNFILETGREIPKWLHDGLVSGAYWVTTALLWLVFGIPKLLMKVLPKVLRIGNRIVKKIMEGISSGYQYVLEVGDRKSVV